MAFSPGTGGSGGGSSIAGSSDVSLNSVQDEQVLTYDSNSAKWQNQDSSSSHTHSIEQVTDLGDALSKRVPSIIIEESQVDSAASILADYPAPTVVYIIPDGAKTW